MNFISIRIITDDVPGLVSFYEGVTGLTAKWSTPVFAEITTAAATLAIAGTETIGLFAPDAAGPAANRSVIIEFQVDDVDAVYGRLQSTVPEFVQKPTTMPWGNRSVLFRDPDGNLVNFFTYGRSN